MSSRRVDERTSNHDGQQWNVVRQVDRNDKLTLFYTPTITHTPVLLTAIYSNSNQC